MKDIEITPEENAILKKVDSGIYCFSDEFEKGNLEGLDFCKEICNQFPEITISPEELGIYFAGEDNDMDYESVKKPVSKKRVIKEHKALTPKQKRIIMEMRKGRQLTLREYEDLMRDHVEAIRDRILATPDESTEKTELKANIMKELEQYYSATDDSAGIAALLLDCLYEAIYNLPEGMITEKDKYWLAKYNDYWDGQEGFYSIYMDGDDFYSDLDPFLKQIVDEFCADHYLDEPIEESKKVDKRRRVIKESAKRPVRRQVRHIRKSK